MNTITIANTPVTIDSQGRVNLNALHKASGEGAGKSPGQWLRNDQIKEYIDVVSDMQNCISLTTNKSGREKGTYAHELVAIEYAGWISPRFRVLVNQTFLDVKRGSVPQQAINQDISIPKDRYISLLEMENTFLRTSHAPVALPLAHQQQQLVEQDLAFVGQIRQIINAQPGINKTALLNAVGKNKHDKTARKLLDKYDGIYWLSSRTSTTITYRAINGH